MYLFTSLVPKSKKNYHTNSKKFQYQLTKIKDSTEKVLKKAAMNTKKNYHAQK